MTTESKRSARVLVHLGGVDHALTLRETADLVGRIYQAYARELTRVEPDYSELVNRLLKAATKRAQGGPAWADYADAADAINTLRVRLAHEVSARDKIVTDLSTQLVETNRQLLEARKKTTRS